MKSMIVMLLISGCIGSMAIAQPSSWALPSTTDPDRALAAYFESEVSEIETHSPARLVTTKDDWVGRRDQLRADLRDMLGLNPEPPRADLQSVVTGRIDGDGFTVENLHFQPMPKLYLAANLYRPKVVTGRLPAILYVCGHSNVSKDGVSLGNKTAYHHHGVWFARHGYVCLIIDTVQWGELVGHHHGTYRLGRWWWASRGYTPAGVEAWNGIRALDYLQSRPEVDPKRIGMTGRSGGGAYTWWVAALDDRVAVACPTAGIASLRNHVLDGSIEGHCDCMFMHNTYRWDFDTVAALVAPRPLLILNTDKDDIFPLDGVYDVYKSTRRIYRLLGEESKIGLHIAEGPHEDVQPLNVGAFAWFERFLKGAKPMATIDEAAKPSLDPAVLRVFDTPPQDERTTRIDEDFVPKAVAPAVPATADEWKALRNSWMSALREHVFRNAGAAPLASLPKPEVVSLADGSVRLILQTPSGPVWSGDERKQTQLRRRFLLLGQTMEGLQVQEIRQAMQSARGPDGTAALTIEAHGEMAALALYASLFEPPGIRLVLHDMPVSHADGPCLLNVLRVLDLPQALTMAVERGPVTLHGDHPEAWRFAADTAKNLGWATELVTNRQ